MKVTAEQIERAKASWYITHGCDWDEQFVAVPHQRPARAANSRQSPPGEGDNLIQGDHDLHCVVAIADALAWSGHQRYTVRAVAEALMADALSQ